MFRTMRRKVQQLSLEDCRNETDEVIAHSRMYCVEIEVDHITGKCGKEVMLERKRKEMDT